MAFIFHHAQFPPANPTVSHIHSTNGFSFLPCPFMELFEICFCDVSFLQTLRRNGNEIILEGGAGQWETFGNCSFNNSTRTFEFSDLLAFCSHRSHITRPIFPALTDRERLKSISPSRGQILMSGKQPGFGLQGFQTLTPTILSSSVWPYLACS